MLCLFEVFDWEFGGPHRVERLCTSCNFFLCWRQSTRGGWDLEYLLGITALVCIKFISLFSFFYGPRETIYMNLQEKREEILNLEFATSKIINKLTWNNYGIEKFSVVERLSSLRIGLHETFHHAVCT